METLCAETEITRRPSLSQTNGRRDGTHTRRVIFRRRAHHTCVVAEESVLVGRGRTPAPVISRPPGPPYVRGRLLYLVLRPRPYVGGRTRRVRRARLRHGRSRTRPWFGWATEMFFYSVRRRSVVRILRRGDPSATGAGHDDRRQKEERKRWEEHSESNVV